MSRIIFLNRFFFPDHSATSQILGDLAFHLAGLGRDVHVITSRQRYEDAGAELPEHEVVDGVSISRVPTTRFGRAGLIGRAFDYLSCIRAMGRAVARLAGPGDVLVAMTDPPLLSVWAARAAARRGARLVNWLQDLYPEIAAELGVPLIKGPLAGALAAMRNRSLRAAAVNVVIGQAMAARLRALGVPAETITAIPNWADDEAITPVAAAGNPLRHEWGLQGKFVVGYSGNLGRAHDIDTVLAAAERLRDDPRIVFIFIGGGRQFAQLAAEARARGLEHTLRFFPYQDRARLKYSLAVPDLHWLSLKSELEGLIFPSKLYGIAAAGRPMVAIAARDGEIARLIEQHRCGVAIAPGDGEGLTRILSELAVDAARCAGMGARARALCDAHFTRAVAFARWRAVLDRLTSAG
jgi:glycosyltransferase involved in cell wall biosynthesis